MSKHGIYKRLVHTKAVSSRLTTPTKNGLRHFGGGHFRRVAVAIQTGISVGEDLLWEKRTEGYKGNGTSFLFH